MEDIKKIWLTPAGAAIALICFFLPWVEFSCGEMRKSISGAEIGGIFGVVFAAAALSLLAFFYFKNTDELPRAKPIVILCSLVALAILIYRYFGFKSGAKTAFRAYRSYRKCPISNRIRESSSKFPI
jgi:apolipoprotein N-acyltransferase